MREEISASLVFHEERVKKKFWKNFSVFFLCTVCSSIFIAATYIFPIRDRLEEKIVFFLEKTKPVLWDQSKTVIILISHEKDTISFYEKIVHNKPLKIYTFDEINQDEYLKYPWVINKTRKFRTSIFDDITQISHKDIKDKIVLIGNEEHKKDLENYSTYINQKLVGGLLKQPHFVFLFILISLSSWLNFILWYGSAFFALLCFFILSFSMLILQSFFQTYWLIFIPLSDVFIFSFFSTLMGAFHRTYKAHIWLLQQENTVKIQKELSHIQNTFFDRFANEMFEWNQRILENLNICDDKIQSQDIFQKVYISAHELRDYLLSIKKITEFENKRLKKISIQEIDLKILMDRLISQFETEIYRKKLKIEMHVPESFLFSTDEIIFESIVFNLLSNAIKYSYPEKKIFIRAFYKKRHKIFLSIEDQGPGIPDELQEKIFEKFFRIHHDETFNTKGHGLGLYFCKFFSKSINGKLLLVSKLEEGSKFTLIVNDQKK